MMKIDRIYRYPVKSMGGEAVETARVTPTGIAGDRRYAVYDVESGNVASAKSPRKWARLLHCAVRYLEEPDFSNGIKPIEISFPDQSTMVSTDPGIDAKLSEVFEREVRLVADYEIQPKSELIWRVVPGQEATEWTEHRKVKVEGSTDVVLFELGGLVPKVPGNGNFMDLAPVHILTTATLRRLSALSSLDSFDARRYRPNILVDTDRVGFVEQTWIDRMLSIGPARMLAALPTPRCVMTTLAQAGLQTDRKSLRAIIRYNTLELARMPGRWACAGIYANPSGYDVISRGDPISVSSTEVRPEIARAMKESCAAEPAYQRRSVR